MCIYKRSEVDVKSQLLRVLSTWKHLFRGGLVSEGQELSIQPPFSLSQDRHSVVGHLNGCVERQRQDAYKVCV